MKTKKAFIITTTVIASSFAIALMSFSGSSLFSVTANSECEYHHGNHYERKDPTSSSSGWQEFWACCECNHQYLSAPNGDWTDNLAENMTGVMSSTHIAYLAPLDLTEINLYKSAYTLSVGDKATIEFNETSETLASLGTLSYSSNSENVSVSNNGIITANTLGNATITVTGSVNGEATISVDVVDSDRYLGFDFALSDEVYIYPNIVNNREELNYAMSYIALEHHRFAKFNVNLSSSINDEDFSGFFEMRDIAPGYLWSDHFLPTSTWGSLEEGDYYTDLPVGEYEVCVSFGYAQDFDYSLASETSPENGHDVTELTNALSEIRRYENSQKNSSQRRSSTFMDFPMFSKNTKGYRDVYNSEELWWSVANGYIPRFPTSHSTAEEIYERCKDILRNEITNDMSDAQKMLAIYDYMSENLRYDYEALDCDLWLVNTAWYLEGPLFEGRCVCDSFSRLYSLLCNIEGLGVERGCGYTDTSGHAWNYVPYQGDWYLTCTTWSQTHLSSETYSDFASFMGVTSSYFEVTSYDTFMADLLYMEDNSGYSRDYKDVVHNSHTTTKSQSFANFATFGNGYDFNINSEAEVSAICNLVYEIGLTKFYVPCVDSSSIFTSNVYSCLTSAGYSNINGTSFGIGNATYVLITAEI